MANNDFVHSKVTNGYTWLMESLTIFNKYTKYESSGCVVNFHIEENDVWMVAGIDKKYMTDYDCMRLTSIGWVFGQSGGRYWGMSKTIFVEKQAELVR